MLKVNVGENFRKLLSGRVALQLLVLLLISFFTIVENYSKNIRTFGALPNVLGEAVIVKNDQEPVAKRQISAKPDTKVEKEVIVSPKPSPLALQKVLAATAPSDSSRDTLCKGITESWKMIPDPSHEGLYVICNTVAEKMTTVGELNAAQNAYRVEHGLGALNLNSKLCEIASTRAVTVSKSFSHDGFESAVEGSGLSKSSYGENIASGPLSGVHFVEWSWDKSPGHKANMLGDWTDGCGGVYDKYAVFLFAK